MVVSDLGYGIATAPRDSAAAGIGRAVQMAVVGVSVSRTCGVRDHAVLLADALGHENVSCSLHWLWRSETSLRGAHAEIRAWTRALATELEAAQPDAVLLHYSTFAYSHRGLPLFVRPTLAAARGARVPLVSMLHEFAYPWTHAGWRGYAWAFTQRAALFEIMHASAAALATTDLRVQWLTSRPWLPKRPVAFAPVFSNLPPPAIRARPDRPGFLIGMFGYAFEGAEAALVLGAVCDLRERGHDVQLLLLGSPGRPSRAADAWLAAARRSGIDHALSFSGVMPAQGLSDALAGCDILVSAFVSGPSSRKGTLAGSLASGRPVIAIDGPRGWSELIRSEAVQVVAPTSRALADAIGALLADEPRREALGARGRAFAENRMGVSRTANAVTALLGDILREPAS